jgi:hypothetical protein
MPGVQDGGIRDRSQKMKELKPISLGITAIWAAVIIGVAIVLRGTPYAGSVLALIGGGAGASLIILGGRCRRQ